jgi:2-keto-4-pentenoate hydratase
MNPWDDERIKRGMTAQLATRRKRLAAGDKHFGWKVGLGAPAMMKQLGLGGPLVAYLVQSAILASGGSVSLKGFTKPMGECEIAVRMAKDLGAGANAADALAAIKDIQPAIEIADLAYAPTSDNLDQILAADIFNRHVIFGDASRPGGSVAGLTSRLIRRGAEASSTTDPQALTGTVTDIVAHVANTLAAFGEKLSAGDVIICGSITPPILLETDETELAHVLDPIGAVNVRFSWS